jgi:hypothetical protein
MKRWRSDTTRPAPAGREAQQCSQARAKRLTPDCPGYSNDPPRVLLTDAQDRSSWRAAGACTEPGMRSMRWRTVVRRRSLVAILRQATDGE